MDLTATQAEELLTAIAALAPSLALNSGRQSDAHVFPVESLAQLTDAGLLMAPVPVEFGGYGFYANGDGNSLFKLLHLLGYSDLSLGRIFEAHVNALELIRLYGTARQMEAAAFAAQAGDLFALWVTDPGKQGVRLDGDLRLSGEKWFCSAAGFARKALITAETEAGTRMLVVDTSKGVQVTDRGVRLAGMRGAVTGSVDFTSVVVDDASLIGEPGDYLREPAFSTGAWRSSAVALGGLAALVDTMREELLASGRAGNLFQRMRFGQSIIAHETGKLWMLETIKRLDSASAEEAVAYVNLARTAVESACFDAIRLVQRSLGLRAFTQGSKTERIARDLSTYLRQPAPDDVLVEAADYFMREGIAS